MTKVTIRYNGKQLTGNQTDSEPILMSLDGIVEGVTWAYFAIFGSFRLLVSSLPTNVTQLPLQYAFLELPVNMQLTDSLFLTN